ncbi:hybrid sensor histidine kinase/response regulator [Alishewanella tabrizica]|uniref:histidine kinase n=1 Tax=Alishewanella tabrizica TaxID=671278 RepID=A0ABQ2WJF2_9ALTE|nr:ATP-binding protein [Alishewanella tabrizica]GGW56913.1 histidine kinase [Alishewanella tabrizica]
MNLSWVTARLGKTPSVRRVSYFAILCGFGCLANLLSVNLPFVIPFLMGNAVFITLQSRFGGLWALPALMLVMLPVSTPVYWFLALAQWLLVALFSPTADKRAALPILLYIPVSAVLLWQYGPIALFPNVYHAAFVWFLVVMLFALNLRASQFLLALSASTQIQKQQHLQKQLSQRIALYSAIPGSLFIALILHATIVLHLSSKVESYTLEQIKRDAELTSLINRYQGTLALAAEMLTFAAPKPVLQALTEQRQEFISALVTDSQGSVISFFKDGIVSSEITNLNVSHRDYFTYPAANGKPIITDSFTGARLGNDLLFAISQPLFNQGEFAGVIEVSVALARLNTVLAASKESFIQQLLLDKENRKLWGSNESTLIGHIADIEARSPSPQHVLLLGQWFHTLSLMRFTSSYEAIVIEHYNQLTGWLHQDKIATTAVSLRYHSYLLLAMLLSVFMLEFIAWASSRFARSYTRSLEQLANYAASWTADENTLTVPPKLKSSSIEFETVLTNLNQLQQRVIESHHELSSTLALRTELNTELEKRVLSRTEELKNERDRAQQLANIKSRFLANMSHEIRTPITVIKGFSEQLLQSQDSAEHQYFSQLIYNNTLHLQRIIDDILDSSKIDEGKLTLVNEFFSVQHFLEDVWQSIVPLADAKHIKLSLQYPLAANLRLNADPFRLKQIMHNLLSNAIKFTEAGTVEISACWQAGHLALSVTDQGIGLSELQISQLFQAFQQADSSTSRRYGGTGLGLYISQHLATMMGMQLTVVSKPAVGSTFTVLIPEHKFTTAAELNHSVPSEPEQPETVLMQGHLLIVDDVPDIRALLAHMLKETGVTFQLAENGRVALQLVEQHTFDLILMDQQMPEMDGIVATEQLRKKGFTKPIIRLSADVYDNKHLQHNNPLFDATLTKPINKKTLLQQVQRFLMKSTPTKPKKPLAEVDEDLASLKHDYLQSLQSQHTRLTQLFVDADFDTLKLEFHKIKGTSACFDFHSISELANQCEQAAKTHNLTLLLLNTLLQEIDKTDL